MDSRYFHFMMNDNSMDDGKKHSISKGDIMVCTPIVLGNINVGDVIVARIDKRIVVGIVERKANGVVITSPYNPTSVSNRILTRRAEFYLVVETRHKRGGSFDDMVICLRGIA